MLTEPNQNPAPAFAALEWNGRKCANSDCKLDHLIGANPATEEALGEVAGPDGLELYAAFFRGRQIGQYTSSVAAMAAINKMYERHQTEQAKIVYGAPGMDPDLAAGLNQAMLMVKGMMGGNGPQPIGLAIGRPGEPPQLAQLFEPPPASMSVPDLTIESENGQLVDDNATISPVAAEAACRADRALLVVHAKNGSFLGRNLGFEGNGINFRPIAKISSAIDAEFIPPADAPPAE
ncbi:MAG: hypothetical protein IPK75_20450 [Acidobacteria bacterium]|nr:hypothetical protein [Acidobacteriota bacterium]